MRQTQSIKLFDFTGGLNTKSASTSLRETEARDLQNINILPNGGFEKRRGNTAFNSSAMNSGAAIQGIGFFRTSAAVDYLMAIAGTKIYKSEMDGVMDEITGAVVITAGQDKLWTHSTIRDLSVWVGGAPDVPIKWNATGNAAALGGSPVSANYGIAANDRMFLANTTASPSRVYWSTLGNPEDWSGAGSGNQDIQANDGDTVIGASVLNTDHLLWFKQNSIHDMAIRTAPFPVFPLFRDVGAVSKRGIVTADGIAYFITPEPRMKATDGTRVIDFPDTIDDVWDSLNKSRLPYLHGIYYKRLHQLMWFVSSSSTTTHDLCLIWDIRRKCWLRHTTGHKMNVSAIVQDRLLYCGAYDGKLYKQDAASTYTDASETSGAINASWRSGWMPFGESIERKMIPYADINFSTQVTGTFDVKFGYDFSVDRKSFSINMTSSGGLWGHLVWNQGVWGSQSDKTRMIHINGSGKFIQVFVGNGNAGEAFLFNGIQFPVNVQEALALR